MTSAPKLSIAMATYNGAAYLERQLDSFAAQQQMPDELVICDDGSTDATVAIVNAFAERAPFEVRLHANPTRLGYNRNFEGAIRRCTGDIIFISDQDDEWYPPKLKVVAAEFAASPSTFTVVNDQDIVREDGSATGATVLQNLRRLGYSDLTFGPGCCTAIRREILSLLDPFPGDDVPYDHWIVFIPAVLGAKKLLDQRLQNYRRHGSNTSGSVFALERPRATTLALGNDKASTMTAYEQKVRELTIFMDRLIDRRCAVDELGLSGKYEHALQTIGTARQAYLERLDCLKQGRIGRIPAIVKMLRSGTYDQFLGYKSAVKDLVA